MRRHVLAALALAALAAAPPAEAATPYAERSDQVVSAAGVTALELDNTRGSVRVRPSTDGRLHVSAVKICRLQREDDARKYLRETTVESRAEGKRWVVKVNYPRRIDSRISFWQVFTEHSGGLQFPVLEVQVTVEAPAGWATLVRTTSGDVDVQGMEGALTVRSTSGDVSVSDTRGLADLASTSGDIDLAETDRARIETRSGDVTASGVGALRIASTSGSIVVEGAKDSLRLSSASGDVQVQEAPRGVTASTTSGDIDVRRARGTVRVESRSGDIELSLEPGLVRCDASSTSGEVHAELDPAVPATIQLRTTSGSLECSAPVRNLSQDRRRLTATLGRGGVPVALQTVSGDLNLTSGGY